MSLASIVFISSKAPDQGAPHQLMPAIWLSRRGFALLCVCRGAGAGGDAPGQFDTPLGLVKARFIRSAENAAGRLGWQLKLFFSLLALRLRLPRGTVFYVHGSVVCPAAWAALAGVPALRKIYHTQDFLEPSRHPVWAFFERRVARGAGQVICNEVNRARFMASHYRLRDMPLVVPTTLPKDWPLSRFQAGRRRGLLKKLGLKGGPDLRLVLHQGPFSPLRCGHQVLQALASLPKDYHLLFTGVEPGSAGSGELTGLVAAAGLEGRVSALGRLSYKELLSVTSICDMGLLLYPNDGVGNFYQAPGRFTEYLGSGLPVVASRFPGLELLVLKHGVGEVCDPESPRDIARGIHALGSLDKASLRRWREKLRRTFQESLCFEQGAGTLLGALARAGAVGAEP